MPLTELVAIQSCQRELQTTFHINLSTSECIGVRIFLLRDLKWELVKEAEWMDRGVANGLWMEMERAADR